MKSCLPLLDGFLDEFLVGFEQLLLCLKFLILKDKYGVHFGFYNCESCCLIHVDFSFSIKSIFAFLVWVLSLPEINRWFFNNFIIFVTFFVAKFWRLVNLQLFHQLQLLKLVDQLLMNKLSFIHILQKQ